MDPGAEVRQWLLSATTATLCTLAAEAEIAGWPFGSLAPFALGGDGTPVVLLSELAQHTKNLRRDPRVALFVRDPLGAGLREAAPGIISHMNADHEDALRAIVAATTGTLPARARIRRVDRVGFLADTTSPDALRYVGFGREIEGAEAREVFVALVRAARAKVSG